jgi:hypothetical protein
MKIINMPKLTETTNDRLASNGQGGPPVMAQLPTNSAPPQPGPLKIALIGTAPSSRMLAPYNDRSWRIWACSPGNMGVLPRFDVWFEVHGNLLWEEHKHYGIPYVEWLKKLQVPLFMQDKSLIPHAHIFPKDELVREFGGDFFTSSFTWMMAFAIKCGAKEVALYGIDMASRDEYILQRPGFYFFRTMARMLGCKVSAPHESDIMQSPGLYGYSDVTPLGRKINSREKELKERIAQQKQAEEVAKTNRIYLEGALEDTDYIKSIWMGAQDNSSPLLPGPRLTPEELQAATGILVQVPPPAEAKIDPVPPPSSRKRKKNAPDLHHSGA